MVRFFLLFAPLSLLVSCGQMGGLVSKLKPGKEDDSFGKVPKIPGHLRAGGSANVTIQPAADIMVDADVDPASLSTEQGGVVGLTPESDIIFTDPDDVEASEAAIQGLFGEEKKDWYSSHTVAKNRALMESKPLLIFFADTPGGRNGGSLASAVLEKELFARTDFAEWAKENLIRLKLDRNFKDRRSVDKDKKSLALRKASYIESLRKQYKVGGSPALIVVAADGSIVQHVRGYRNGSAEYTWGLLKTGVVLSSERQKKVEARLEKKGYRRWTGNNDLKILARLAKYQNGELLLIAPNGARYVTKESNLSRTDQQWLQAQKDKRSGR
ncbi:MAG: hypothetical protein ACSHYB_06500 [Roseibacillus sp.]